MNRREALSLISVIPVFVAIPFRFAWFNAMVILDPIFSRFEHRPWKRAFPPRARPAEASWVHLDEPIHRGVRSMIRGVQPSFVVATLRPKPVPESDVIDDDPHKGPPWYVRLEPLEPDQRVAEADWEHW